SERDVRIEDRPIEALEADRSELRRTMATLEERLGQQRFAGPALDAERFAEVRKDVETLEARREELAQRIAHLRGVLEGSGDEAEELAALTEALEAAGRDLHRHRRGLQVRQLAKAVLAEARQAAIAPAVEVFERIVGRYLAGVSAGRYRTVRLGRSVVDLAVLGPEREEFVTSEELSYGTAEQLLLAARLTLAELLAGEKRPPLLLDEPFGAFDEGRLRATMELLSAIAAHRQVILFTHQEAVAEACDHVVVLPPPVGGAPRPEAEKTF
ncbi:MAG: ATP-binding protein, partial [Candidatus Tectimicrobiota bacterium]